MGVHVDMILTKMNIYLNDDVILIPCMRSYVLYVERISYPPVVF